MIKMDLEGQLDPHSSTPIHQVDLESNTWDKGPCLPDLNSTTNRMRETVHTIFKIRKLVFHCHI